MFRSLAQAAGAALLFRLDGDHGEGFLAYRAVRAAPHDIRALLSATHLRIFTLKQQQPHVVMETHLRYRPRRAAHTVLPLLLLLLLLV